MPRSLDGRRSLALRRRADEKPRGPRAPAARAPPPRSLSRNKVRCCSLYLMDALFATEPPKFLAGALAGLSSMIALELPHVNVLTKCGLVARTTTTTLGSGMTR